jgi:tetratricopeptide (TPR) repeat protein
MTDSHHLLFRLAELMLQQEEQILPVDMLFDDEQIGEFVKSIQIDSPYQQMLIEGVLTESVQAENLYVSFTVEGYFHYVLGEVLLHQYTRMGPEWLIYRIQTSNFKGLEPGLTIMLQSLIKNKDYDFLKRILSTKSDSDFIVPAITQLLMIEKEIDFIFEIKDSVFWDKVLKTLQDLTKYSILGPVLLKLPPILTQYLINDAIARHISGDQLKLLQESLNDSGLPKNPLIAFYLGNYEDVIHALEPNSELSDPEKVCLISSLIDSGEFDRAILKLNQFEFSLDYQLENQRLLAIAYHGSNDTEKSNSAIEIAISQCSNKYGSFHFKTAELLNLSGLLALAREDYEKATKTLNRSLRIFESSKGKKNFEYISNLGNLALSSYFSGKLEESISIWMQSVTLLQEINMGSHPETALVLKNLAFALKEIKKPKEAVSFAERALKVFKETGMINTSSYSDCNKLLLELKE